MIRYFVLLLALFFLTPSSFSQVYEEKVSNVSPEIAGKKTVGYVTWLDFPVEEVRYGFWKYSRKFGLPKNMRTHYEVIIPARESTANQSLTLYALSISGDPGCKFSLSLDLEALPEAAHVNYQKQVRDLLMDFKLNFYLDYFDNQISELERIYNRQARKYKRLLKKRGENNSKEKVLDDLLILQNKISLLKENKLTLLRK